MALQSLIFNSVFELGSSLRKGKVVQTIPSWLLEALPDQADALKAAATAETIKLAERCLKTISEASALAKQTLDKGDLASTLLVAEQMLEATRTLISTVQETSTTATGDARPASGKTHDQRSYDRCWYYTMARRPADLLDRTYKYIKEDPRIVKIWAEAKALDAAGKLSSSGKVI